MNQWGHFETASAVLVVKGSVCVCSLELVFVVELEGLRLVSGFGRGVGLGKLIGGVVVVVRREVALVVLLGAVLVVFE